VVPLDQAEQILEVAAAAVMATTPTVIMLAEQVVLV